MFEILPELGEQAKHMDVALLGNMKHEATLKCVELNSVVRMCEYSACLIVVFEVRSLHFSQQCYEGHLLEAGDLGWWESIAGW